MLFVFCSEREKVRLLDLVCARLQEVMRANSYAPVLDPDAVAEAHLLARHMTAFDPDMSAWHALGWFHWLRYEALGEERGGTDRVTAVENFLPCFLFGEDNIPGSLLTELAEQAAPGAARSLGRAIDSDDAELVARCVVLWGAIADALPDGHRLRGIAWSSLGHSLLLRHGHTREPGDLDEAIASGRKALMCQAGAEERSGFLHNLGLAFQVRFEETRDVASLVEAVTAHLDAVAVAPPDSPILTTLISGLATAQMVAHDRAGENPAHLDATIDVLRAVLDRTAPDDPHRAGRLSNLSTMLQLRYDLLAKLADLDEAVVTASTAVEITPQDHARLPVYLTRLADVLHARFEHARDAADLGDSIRTGRRAVELTPADHPHSVVRVLSLAAALRCEGSSSGSEEAVMEAARLYASAARDEIGRPADRVAAARCGAALLARSDPSQARELLEAAVHLLPEVVPLELTRADHVHVFGGLTNLAGDAAALTLADHSIPEEFRGLRALGLLDEGRAVVSGARFDLRGGLVDLRRRHPELAARFTAARDSLDRQDRPSVTVDRHQLVDELRAALTAIRAQTGFESFGRPPELSELVHEGAEGPVVVFNVSKYRCDALVVTAGGVRVVALPEVTLEALIREFKAFYEALHTPEEPVVLPEVLEWLWDKVVEPVFTALGYSSGSEEARRVWWAPGGVLGLLPLHAAGHHDDPLDAPDRRTTLDRVVSSYTPSVRALRHARRRTAARPPVERALIVAMPTTPGKLGDPLPSAAAEAELVRRLVPGSVLLSGDLGSGISSGPPTKAAVLENLAECSIAHFICHARPDPVEPSRSLLVLYDSPVDPLTVAALDEVEFDHAHLAYLSACTTASTHNVALIEESTHLAAAFQLAGFPNVIGTLWGVGDRVGVRIAEQFYEALMAQPDRADPALALHRAVHLARARYPGRPSAWAPHQHFGA
ncbi:CHAT domain-containing protein [Amycolatopsis sp. lyj-109]|uniref:CHAT domain-containing protein n=1 Tax=Amycolatopsis sp. lyj-109 TaxID=2789287 RepID=UPI00397989FD